MQDLCPPVAYVYGDGIERQGMVSRRPQARYVAAFELQTGLRYNTYSVIGCDLFTREEYGSGIMLTDPDEVMFI